MEKKDYIHWIHIFTVIPITVGVVFIFILIQDCINVAEMIAELEALFELTLPLDQVFETYWRNAINPNIWGATIPFVVAITVYIIGNRLVNKRKN